MLRRFLQHVIDEPFLTARQSPFKMLVLDDEADDASVLDSESSLKVTPRLITALWSGDSDLSETRHENFLASYVLSDALRSFLVGAAIRLHQGGSSLTMARSAIFDTAEAAKTASPLAHIEGRICRSVAFSPLKTNSSYSAVTTSTTTLLSPRLCGR